MVWVKSQQQAGLDGGLRSNGIEALGGDRMRHQFWCELNLNETSGARLDSPKLQPAADICMSCLSLGRFPT